MNEKKYTTIGRTNYKGKEVKISCERDITILEDEYLPERFRIVYVKEGIGTFFNGDYSQTVTAPAVLCINNTDHVRLTAVDNIIMDMMVFEPSCFERYIPYDSIEDWKKSVGEDSHFFRAFFERSEKYIGVCSTTVYAGDRVTQLIIKAEKELTEQGTNWPCRSRSFFIELLLLVNTIYDEDEVNDSLYADKMTDEIRQIVNWINTHFVDKITLDDISKAFSTNRTTLNIKFKNAMGITVTEYIISLRMEIASSCLKKTLLSIGEILTRTGYKDEAHFLRAFKKFYGCTPTQYRQRYSTNE